MNSPGDRREKWHERPSFAYTLIVAIITLCLAILVQAGSIVWWASKTDTRVEKLEQHVSDTKFQAAEIATLQAQFGFIRETLTEIKVILRRERASAQ